LDCPVPGGVGGIVMVGFGGWVAPPSPVHRVKRPGAGPLPQGEWEAEIGHPLSFPQGNAEAGW
jgi:hypothetical protein